MQPHMRGANGASFPPPETCHKAHLQRATRRARGHGVPADAADAGTHDVGREGSSLASRLNGSRFDVARRTSTRPPAHLRSCLTGR